MSRLLAALNRVTNRAHIGEHFQLRDAVALILKELVLVLLGLLDALRLLAGLRGGGRL